MGRGIRKHSKDEDNDIDEVVDDIESDLHRGIRIDDEQYDYVSNIHDIREDILAYRNHMAIPVCEYLTIDGLCDFIDSLFDEDF